MSIPCQYNCNVHNSSKLLRGENYIWEKNIELVNVVTHKNCIKPRKILSFWCLCFCATVFHGSLIVVFWCFNLLQEQKWIIAVLFMVPVYATESVRTFRFRILLVSVANVYFIYINTQFFCIATNLLCEE